MRQIPDTIFDAIGSINLPVIPHALVRFIGMVDDDTASITDLAELLRQDPSLSARFLTVANSPALRRGGGEVKGLDQCLISLGTRLARTLATCLAIQNVFSRTVEGFQYDFSGFWGHSLIVAEQARSIAAKIGHPDLEEAYLAGLLHDIGQLLLLGGVGDRYGELLRLRIDEAVLSDLEVPLFGTDHAVVGAWLIDQWKLSSFMADAVLFHHRPGEEAAGADPLSRIVWAAHVSGSCCGTLYLADGDRMPGFRMAEAMTGLDLMDLEAIRSRSVQQVADLAAALRVTGATSPPTLPDPFLPFGYLPWEQRDDDPPQKRLNDVVRDLALLQSLKRDLSAMDHEPELLLAVRESARILFGIARMAYLLIDPERGALAGPDFDGQPPLVQQLEIKLDPARSLAAAAALGELPRSTFDLHGPTQPSLADVQIARALESEGVLYVPLCNGDERLGVMVYGLSSSQFERLRPRLAGMAGFGRLAAAAMASWRSMRDQERLIEQHAAEQFRQQARRIVHEAGNPLAIIRNYLKIVARKLPDGTDLHQELDILKEEIDRVSRILRQLGATSPVVPVPGLVDLNAVIEGMLALYGETLFSGCGITVEKQLAPGLGPVAGDRDSISQILLNLWKNSAEAMPEGGRLVIATRGDVMREGRRYAEICVGDNGPGLPPEVRRRLFQPLEPDRRPGHFGVGLSIVAALVARLGGHISCDGSAECGTRFLILLPHGAADGAS